jgi:hypothetical protein
MFMTKNLILILIYFTLIKCKSQTNQETFETDDDGITVEKFDSTDTDKNRFNRNNEIYTVGKKFTFSYYYQDLSGTKYLMTRGNLNDENTYDWVLEKPEKKNGNSVSQITLLVNSGLSPFIEHLPDYNQTVITYDYKLSNGEFWTNEMTGVIENKKNLWMHPPRTEFFKILEINPFPYIKEPYEIGTSWGWRLKFGSHWSDKRWLEWKGSNENIYSYTITEKINLQTKLGQLDCLVVSGTAISALGETKLISYFNKLYGFVKLDYTNIDGTKTVLELEKVE